MVRSILGLVTCLLAASTSFAAHGTAVVSANIDLEGSGTSASSTAFTATIDGDQEVPAVTTEGKGTGAFRLDDEGLHYTITVSGLSGDITNAHLHRAAAGSSGGVVHGIASAFSGNTARGVWRTNDTLTSELIGALLAGELYVNIHTAENPGGEIRGQVLVAGGVGLWSNLTIGQAVSGSSGSGSGSAAMILDGDGLHYWVTIDNLTGPITNAHFHNAPAGSNGGVVFGINDTFTGTTATGLWPAADMTPDNLAELLAGNLYINIHTAENGGGEVRGQVAVTAGLRMIARLSGDEEVPAVATGGSGTAVVTFDGTNVSYRLTVTGLTEPLMTCPPGLFPFLKLGYRNIERGPNGQEAIHSGADHRTSPSGRDSYIGRQDGRRGLA